MPLTTRSKGLLITLTGVLFIVPDALFVRLIGGDALVTAFWRSLICGLLILLGVLLSQGKAGVATLARMGWPGWFYTAVVGFAGLGFVVTFVGQDVGNHRLLVRSHFFVDEFGHCPEVAVSKYRVLLDCLFAVKIAQAKQLAEI